jgi:hypothetical protein
VSIGGRSTTQEVCVEGLSGMCLGRCSSVSTLYAGTLSQLQYCIITHACILFPDPEKHSHTPRSLLPSSVPPPCPPPHRACSPSPLSHPPSPSIPLAASPPLPQPPLTPLALMRAASCGSMGVWSALSGMARTPPLDSRAPGVWGGVWRVCGVCEGVSVCTWTAGGDGCLEEGGHGHDRRLGAIQSCR